MLITSHAHAGLGNFFFGLFSKSESASVKALAKGSEKGSGHLAGDAVTAATHSTDSPYITAQLARIAAKCISYSSQTNQDEQKRELRCTAMQNQFLKCVSIKTKQGLAEESASDFCAIEENAQKIAPKQESTSWWMAIIYVILLIALIAIIKALIGIVWTWLVARIKRIFEKKEKNE